VASPADVLRTAYDGVSGDLATPVINIPDIANDIELVCRNEVNRACVRVLLACSLAKSSNPSLDIRKPYTEIGTADSYAGRMYDQDYIQSFVMQHHLPCNPTTAWLTPALRNRNITLTPDVNLVGRPPQVYNATLRLLAAVYEGRISAEDLLSETIRRLIIIRDEKLLRMNTRFVELESLKGAIPLSSEDIVTLIEQHLKSPNSSRLPVLAVAAAYEAAKEFLGEKALPLEGHNAADKQTRSLGDIQITLVGDDNVVTAYEMKAKKVTQNDIDIALQKVNRTIDNYIIITTEVIDEQVKRYAASIYAKTGGIEFVILDCIGFIRHFLHLFHRIRINYLNAYQRLLLEEPDSAVRQSLKESFLALRVAAETAYANVENEGGPEQQTLF
jgi:DNA adenine methylase